MTDPYRKLAAVPDYPPEPTLEEQRKKVEDRLKDLERRVGSGSIHAGGGYQIGPMTQLTPELIRDLTREISALRTTQIEMQENITAASDEAYARSTRRARDDYETYAERDRKALALRRVTALWWLFAAVNAAIWLAGWMLSR